MTTTIAAQQRIRLQQIEKQFTGLARPAVAQLSIELSNGGVIGLVGPDGAGKTSLLRMIAGLMKPTTGTLQVLDLDPFTDSKQLHSILGYMPQRFGLYEDLTVMENLQLYADLRNLSKSTRQKKFQQLLQFTSLDTFTDRLAGKLSGGMKQKLGLACTLLGDPQVLLLDEPGVGVDPISRRELWQLIDELAEEGMLVLWSTSYLDEAEQCSYVLLMNEGCILYQGVPQQLTSTIEGRVLLITPQDGDKRRLLQQALQLPEVCDAVIQGQYVRLLLHKWVDFGQFTLHSLFKNSSIISAESRFEDAFIDLLGGIPSIESPLTKIIPQFAGEANETVIEARYLTKKFGDFVATDNVNFSVQRGEIFGLLGPNGAGKSTTFKMMCGLMIPSDGQALVLGMDFKKSSQKNRQHIGYMAQKFSLYSNLTVLQNLYFFSGIYGLRHNKQQQKIEEMIAAFNLSAILAQRADNLPLGFKQRLALSCALLHEPDILFLDEPTSGVDPITRREFWLHINGMVNNGVTVMVTTHFMDEAEYCDRIGLVHRGQLIAIGSPDRLKQQCRSDEQPDPSMEDAFITLIQRHDLKNGAL